MVRVLGIASLLLFSHIALVSAATSGRKGYAPLCLTGVGESYDNQLNQLSCSPYA